MRRESVCKDVFQTFVKVGDSISVDFPVTKEDLSPSNKSDREMTLVLFSANRKSVKYTT